MGTVVNADVLITGTFFITVITGLVPVIPMLVAQRCPVNRDRRDKPGDDDEI